MCGAERKFKRVVDQIQENKLNSTTGLAKQKADLSIRKIEIQSELSQLNAQLKGHHIPASKYAAISKLQKDLKGELVGIERQIISISLELREIADSNFAKNITDKAEKPILPVLVALRDEYEVFASDATRVASMRRMASEFAVKLTRIIRDL